MSKVTITAPHADYEGSIGPVRFANGKAETDNDAVIAYARSAGYTVDGEVSAEALSNEERAQLDERHPDPSSLTLTEARAILGEPADPRDLGTEGDGIVVRGTALRDAAVDPMPEDFLPPTNAGEANPHGPLVVAPGVHGTSHRAIRPGAVRNDVAEQQADETEHATRILVDNADAGEVTAETVGSNVHALEVNADDKEAVDRGPLGLSDPGSVAAGVEQANDAGSAADASVDAADTGPADTEPPAKSATVGEWRDYARTAGAGDEVEGMTKAELVENYGAGE